MKKWSIMGGGILALVIIFLISMIPTSNAANKTKEITLKNQDITYNKIQDALNENALDENGKQKHSLLKVKLISSKPRTVELTNGLRIYSNTELIIENVTFKAMKKLKGGAMLKPGDKKESETPEYTGWANIKVKGGVWDANYYQITVFTFRHGSNAEISNLTAKNSVGHTINISASKDVTVSGVTIKDSYTRETVNKRYANLNNPSYEKYKPFSNREVLHLDYAGSGEPSIYQDGTAVQNITITNCTFENVPCAIGSHLQVGHVKVKTTEVEDDTGEDDEIDEKKLSKQEEAKLKETCYGKNITISKCTFINVEYYAFNLLSHKNVKINVQDDQFKFISNNGKKGKAVARFYNEALKNDFNTYNHNEAGINILEDKKEKYQNVFEKGISQMATVNSEECSIILPVVQYNSGKELKPMPVVKYGDKDLKFGEDFIIKAYSNNKKAGDSATIKIKGIGDYKQNKTQNFKIVKGLINVALLTIDDIPDQTFTGIAINPGITVRNGGAPLIVGKDYTIKSYGKNIEKTGTIAIVGNGQYTGTTIKTFNIVKPVGKVSLNKESAILNKGKTLQLTATITPTDATNKKINWDSNCKAVAEVDTKGKVTAKGGGEAIISATSKDGNIEATCTITVPILVQQVSLGSTRATMNTGDNLQLSATVTPDDATNQVLEWRTNNESIAKVDKTTGLVTAQKQGTAVITVAATDGSGRTASCTITVNDVKATGVSLDKKSATIEAGKTLQLNATVIPENTTNKALKWTSSNTNIATVNENTGLVTAKTAGKVTIKATAKDGSNKFGSCEITITAKPVAVTGVTINNNPGKLENGNNVQLSATVLPNNATNKNLKWTSSNTNIATVNENTGLVTAKTVGKVTIKATAKDGSNKFGSCEITITAKPVAVTGVTINNNPGKLEKGNNVQLSATVSPNNATNKNLKWTSSNTNIATINENTGLVTAKAEGTTVITAEAKDGSGKKATCSITITAAKPVVEINKNLMQGKKLVSYNLTNPKGEEVYTFTSSHTWGGYRIPDDVKNNLMKVGRTYVLRFKIQKTDANTKLLNIGGSSTTIEVKSFTIDGKAASTKYGEDYPVNNIKDDLSVHTVELIFKYNKIGNIYIQPNRGKSTKVTAKISNVEIFEQLETYSTCTVTNINGGYRITTAAQYGGFKIPILTEELNEGKTYVLRYTVQRTGGTLKNIGGDCQAVTPVSLTVDGKTASIASNKGEYKQDVSNTGTHTIEFKFKRKKSGGTIYIQPNRGLQTSVTADICNIAIFEAK